MTTPSEETTIFVQVDSFTNKPFSGNPAAVCILSPESTRDDEWMKNVAAEMNLSETAYVVPRKDRDGFDLRWFTPTTEVDLCGHATLASAYVLWQDGHLARNKQARFHTLSGLLTADLKTQNDEDWIEMDFPSEPEVTVSEIPDILLKALGITPIYVGKNRMDYIFVVESEETVRNLQPNLTLLKTLDNYRGVIVTSRAVEAVDSSDSASSYDFVSRFFAPGAGIDEDPVTGSAHCCLGPYWSKHLNKEKLVGRQVSQRGGEVRVCCKGDRVFISGQVVTTLRGMVMH